MAKNTPDAPQAPTIENDAPGVDADQNVITADTDGPVDPAASVAALTPADAPAAMTRADLIAAMDAHEAESDRLDAAMATLGLTAKDVKAIRKAEKAAAAARKTLDALMGIDAAATAQASA